MQRRPSPYLYALWLAPVVFTGLFWRHGLTFSGLLYCAVTSLLLLVSAIDCDRLILPDILTLPGAALTLAASPCLDLPFTESLLGAIVGSVVFWGLACSFPDNLGLGDAKFMLLLGALCGVRGLPVVVAVGAASGLIAAKCTRQLRIPFGPFLSIGAYLHMLGVRV